MESSIHERTKQSQKQTEDRKKEKLKKKKKKTNRKLVGYGTSLGKWHFVWGRKKNGSDNI